MTQEEELKQVMNGLDKANTELLKLGIKNLTEFDRYDDISKAMNEAYILLQKQAEYIGYVNKEI